MKLSSVMVALLLAVPAGIQAQDTPVEKKLYCWNEGGRKVCGDALPPSAVNSARTEINPNSGMRTGEVNRVLTGDEKTQAERAAQQANLAAEAEATRKRHDLAMVESYATENDLRRAYGERITLVEEALKTSRLGTVNLRLSLLSLLRQASELELGGKPVPDVLLGKIRTQHGDLLRQQTILSQQLQDRASLGSDLDDALNRYRAMKAPQSQG